MEEGRGGGTPAARIQEEASYNLSNCATMLRGAPTLLVVVTKGGQ